MKPQCDKCQEYFDKGELFCGSCGYRFPHHDNSNVLDSLMLVAAGIAALLLICEAVLLLVKFGDVFFIVDELGMDFTVIIPTPTRLASIYGIWAQIYWVILSIILVVCVIYGVKKFIDPLVKKDQSDKIGSVAKTAIFWIGVLFSANLIIELAYMLITSSMGYVIDSSWMNDYSTEELLFLLANASFWEEIITRVLYIGVPIFIIQLIRTKKMDSVKYLMGGFGMSKTAVIFIVFSGIMFGLAHDSGWGFTKAFITCLGGIIMGYVFVRFGLYASILMHFLTDYLASFIFTGISGISVIFEFAFIGLGLCACAYLIQKYLNNKDLKEHFKKMPLFSDKDQSNNS